MEKKALITRHNNAMRKYEKIVRRFDELYHRERIRIDDVYTQVMEEFCVSKSTIRRAMKAVK